MSRLVVVSNRVAVPKATQPAPGGLAMGVLSALRDKGGLWLGWNGRHTRTPPREPEIQQESGVSFATLTLSTEDYREYYQGFANRVLWPLFHYRMHLLHYERRFFEGYKRVNAWLADKLMPLLKPEDVIWIHDYHLIPLAAELRARGAQHKIGFFLHTPFPPYDIFRALPDYGDFLQWLCEYNLVGFQTSLDLENFLDSVKIGLRAKVTPRLIVTVDRHNVHTGVFPIGINVEQVTEQAETGRESRRGQRLLQSLEKRKQIIGVDRLDYSKGLIQRFHAYRRMLERYPDLRGNVVFTQIAQPSRSDVPEYQEIRQQLDAAAGEIIGRYADYNWTPIRYLGRSFARPRVLGFLAISRVALITPLRDGMNLVAKEYVAAQDPDDPGVLILSRLAGAAEELDGALLVNPYDIDGVAERLAGALAMSLEERQDRWQRMMTQIRKHDIHAWRDAFLGSLEHADAADE
ncbi:MAG TPA: alpha,alpha-trehalose-phosphate synthase (UDP-forming) [Gammaproteobacteria bacterium]|nr:alpha,alpha-trehalose-phosphate synthase (UDP-forming) [Gammaproteobacteria bacterium]